MTKKQIRESQFELLRLVAMFFIIMHHLIIKGADTVGYITPYSFDEHGVVGVVINSFCICAVNLFVLITGWFGIKNILKGVIRLIIDCAVFGAISYFTLCIFSEHFFSIKECIKSLFFTPNWFVSVYMMLILISPLIEYAVKALDVDKLKYIVIALLVVDVFFGFCFKYNNGYDLTHFVSMYCLARLMRHSCEEKWNIILSKYGFWIYFLGAIVLSIGFIALNKLGIKMPALGYFLYNNPLIILMAMAIFLWFSKCKIQSKFINVFATGVFGTFILHTTPYVIPVRNEYTHMIFQQFGYMGVFVACILLFFVCCLLSIFVNRYNQKLTNYFTNNVIERNLL